MKYRFIEKNGNDNLYVSETSEQQACVRLHKIVKNPKRWILFKKVERTRKVLECKRCWFRWMNNCRVHQPDRVPKRCPSCKTTNWDVDAKKVVK